MKQYNPRSVAVIIGGKAMQGFADGTFITIKRDEDMWNLAIGCDGIGTRAKTNNFSGTIEMTFHQSSPSNDVLSGYVAADELSSSGAVPFLMREGETGNSLAAALTCWVKQPAQIEYGKTISNRVWSLHTDNIQIFVGSNA